MSIYTRIVLAVALTLTFVAFQNCAPPKSKNSESSSSSRGNNNNNGGGYIPCHNVFCASFYNDIDRVDFALEMTESMPFYSDWGGGSPDPSIEPDTFSAYYLGNFDFEAGSYEVSVTADDGVQLVVDGITVIDQYFDQGPTTYTAIVPMTAGNHAIEILYYENGGGAALGASWTKL